MIFDIDESLEHLMTWIRGFDFVSPDVTSDQLCDGIIISKILMAVSPYAFTNSRFAMIKTGDSISSVDKSFNLNHIVGAMSEFFETVIGQPLAIYQLPNVTLIAEMNDTNELRRLLQLVICCAVNGENKEFYIQGILNMEQAVQQAVMETIQEVMNEKSSEKDESSLLSKLVQLEAEKSTVESELEEALHKISLLEEGRGGVADGEPGSVGATLQVRQLQDKLRTLQEELFQSEADAQESKMRLVEARKTIEELRKTCDTLTRQADEAAHFKDELDITREELREANRRAASVDQLKKRADEAVALRVRCTKLEADNAACLKRVAELEQENRLNSSLRVQAEATRNQSAEASSRASELELRALQMEDELKKTKADLLVALREKDTLFAELKRLRDSNEKELTPPELETGDCLVNLQSHLHSSPKSAERNGHLELKNDTVYEVEQLYRGYLAKALEVIRQLDRRAVAAETAAAQSGEQQQPPDAEITRLQALLVEKENIIEQLERHHEQARRQRDLEERMVLTAWYHLGMRMNRANTEARLYQRLGDPQTLSTPSSFLAQQRVRHLHYSPPPSSSEVPMRQSRAQPRP
uniref:Calponin-homology (CH) domain-containing protein n=2 Tax=Mesocestoides corti TaxID=53468 RepID=A0A5K3FKQ6_MESCO